MLFRSTLSYIGDQVTLDVRDDGAGFTPAGAVPAGAVPAGAVPAGAVNARVTAGGRTAAPVTAGGVTAGGLDCEPGPPDSHLGGGFGLTAMRERVEGLSGTLVIESEPGGGTTISASLPVPCAGGAQ